MKKVAVFVLAAAMTANVAMGQFSIGGRDVYIGVRAGVNFTKLGGGDVYNFMGLVLEEFEAGGELKMSFKPGIQLGAVADVALSDVLSVQPGLLFSQTGYKIKVSSEESMYGYGDIEQKTTMSQTLNYIQIPVNFQYKNSYGSNVLWLQAGPYVGFGVGTKTKIKTSMTADGDTESESASTSSSFDEAGLKAFDFGLGFGIGLEFDGMFQAGIGYNLGLTNFVEDMSLKNRGLTFTVTYFFGK